MKWLSGEFFSSSTSFDNSGNKPEIMEKNMEVKNCFLKRAKNKKQQNKETKRGARSKREADFQDTYYKVIKHFYKPI